jgi:outer membrane protein assembly factor BamB
MRTSIPSVRSFLFLPILAVLAPSPAPAEDWTGWRGPRRDGSIAPIADPGRMPGGLKTVWKVTVGEGHSSPVTSGGKVFLLVRRGEEEAALALDAKSGKEAWRSTYPAPYKPRPEAESHGKWPRATPAVDGGVLFTFGVSGVLSAFDAEAGTVLWRKDFAGEYSPAFPGYGSSASPLIEGDLCIVPVGGGGKGALAAFRKRTGEPVWSAGADGPSYSSPVIAELGGVRQVVVLTKDHVEGVSLDGKVLWQSPFRTIYDQNICTPVISKDLVIFGGVEQPTRALRISGAGSAWKAEEAWKDADVPLYMNTPVLQDGLLFGMSTKRKGSFFCVDAASGKTMWQSKGAEGENAVLVAAGPLVWAQTTGGELVAFRASGTGFSEVARYRLSGQPTWAHPVLGKDFILVKDSTSLACLAWERTAD